VTREPPARRFRDDDGDDDTRAVRRASRMVGLQITVASAAVTLAVVLAVFLFVISEVKPADLFELHPDPDKVDVSAILLLRTAIGFGVLVIVVAGVLSWLVARRAVRPLGAALRIQRSFVADASHELRTPLAVLDARLQILQRGLPEGDPSAAVVGELRRDAGSLIQIVNELLESAEEAGAPVGRAALPVELTGVVEHAVESMRLIGDDRSISIALTAGEPVSTYLPSTTAHRCMVALLDNALRFSPPHSRVDVDIAASKSTVTITVRDHGGGIRGIDPARIFDRSARAEGESSGARTGFGIGLALVRDITVRNGGSVRVLESSPSGTAIALTVPRAPGR
jgi:two-component system OmpR family sensor kinase